MLALLFDPVSEVPEDELPAGEDAPDFALRQDGAQLALDVVRVELELASCC